MVGIEEENTCLYCGTLIPPNKIRNRKIDKKTSISISPFTELGIGVQHSNELNYEEVPDCYIIAKCPFCDRSYRILAFGNNDKYIISWFQTTNWSNCNIALIMAENNIEKGDVIEGFSGATQLISYKAKINKHLFGKTDFHILFTKNYRRYFFSCSIKGNTKIILNLELLP